jgi:potassium efflux system protein
MKTATPLKLYCLLLLLLASVNVFAETVDSKPDTQQQAAVLDITKDSLQAKIDALAERKGLDEALKSKLLALYQSAQDDLSNIVSFDERTTSFKNAIQQAPELSKKLQKDIDLASEKQPKPNTNDFTKIPLEELTQRLVIEQGKVNQLDEQIKKLDNELAEQSNRPNLIRQEILKAKQELDNAHKEIKDIAATTQESKLEIDAHQVYLKTQIDAKTAELSMLDAETNSYSARRDLLKARLQLLGLQKNAFAPLITTIENVLTQLREQEEKDRQDAISQAEKDLVGKPAVIQDVSHENIQYNQNLQSINSKIAHYTEEKAKTDKQISEIDTNFNSAAKKIDLASISPPLGKILHEQRRNLLNQDQFILQSESIQTETAETNLAQLEVEEKLKQLADIDGILRQKMDSSVDKKLPTAQRMLIQAELRVLINEQSDLLTELSVVYNDYLRTLGDFDFARQQGHSKMESFALYLDEHLLWVRSSEAIGSNFILGVYRSTQWLFSPTNWQSVLKNVAHLPAKNPFLTLFALLNVSLLLLAKNWAKRRLVLIAIKIEKIYTDSFACTIEALIYSVIFSAPLPLIIAYIGWFLSDDVSNNNFTQAIGMGLKQMALLWFLLQFLYRLFAPTGIMHTHFQWQENTAALVRKQLAWIRFVVIPCAFIIKTSLASEIPTYSDNLGRLALNISTLAVMFFLARLLHPSRGLLQDIVINYPDSWLAKLRYIIYTAAFTPLIIIGFSVAGYHLSALELQQKLIVTLGLIFLIDIVYEIILRWLTLVNRQLAIKNLLQKRQTTESEKHSTLAGAEDPILPVDISERCDIPKINAQTIRILNVLLYFTLIAGFWVIWKNILPAFSFLERIELWQNKTTVNNQEVYQSITLISLFLAGFYTLITIVSVRNFSGVMELLLFRRLAIESGSRYAVNQLAKYILMIVGFFSVTNELGFNWSQVQWLVAALSVGLGFGLQEIFANFVSGIILLFERPIRVGDIVTIGDVSGKISRIHMRATTLIDFDQKELIVPNKTFITTQLINWTLSDRITRVGFTVGIAYDADIELAHEVMLETVRTTPLILQEPEPSVLLLAFADSALKFSISFYVSETAHRLPVTHDLHIRLVNALHDHHIEIPVPQQDIHIRSITPE